MDFCCDEVLSGRPAVRTVAETDHMLAFHHTRPCWPVHLVVIPKRHIGSLATVESEDMPIVQEMLQVASDLCRQVTAEYGGCRVSSNSGDFQSTKHLHFYIHHGKRPRNEDGSQVTKG